jgi:hypothetical protein
MSFRTTWSQPCAFCSWETMKFLATCAPDQGNGFILHAPMAPEVPVLTYGCWRRQVVRVYFHQTRVANRNYDYETLKPLEAVVIMLFISHRIGNPLFWVLIKFKRLTLVPKTNNLCFQKHLHTDGTAWLKKMDSISYFYISLTIHGMRII